MAQAGQGSLRTDHHQALVAFMAFGVMAAFWPDVSGAALIPRWALIGLAPMLILWMPPSRWTLAHLAGLCLLAWGAVSLAWTSNMRDGAGVLAQWCLLAAVFGLGMRVASLRLVYAAATLGLAVSSAVVLFELVYPSTIQPSGGKHAGLFFNPNMLAEVTALVLIGVIGHRIWWAVALLIPAITFPQGRGAWLALAVAGTVYLWQRSRVAALSVTLLGVCAATVLVLVGFKNYSSVQRVDLFLDSIPALSWLGNGLGSYDTTFPYFASRIDVFVNRPQHAHNDYLQLVLELGPGSLFAGWLLYLCLRGPLTIERYVLIAFCVEAAFDFPSYMPATGFMAALVMGHLCRGRRDLRDELHSCRTEFLSRARHLGHNLELAARTLRGNGPSLR